MLKRMCHKIAYSGDVGDLLQDCALYVIKAPPPQGITPQWLWVVALHRHMEVKRKARIRGDLVPTTHLEGFGDEGPPATYPPPQENQTYLKEVLRVVHSALGTKTAHFLNLCQTGEAGKGAPKGFSALTSTERGQLLRARNRIKDAMEAGNECAQGN